MIFDSFQMATLRQKYNDIANYEVPEIVFLDRFDGYEGERQLLEELFASVSASKQKDWIGRLINEDPSQHIGVWFELMLFGWLREHFTVQVEPEVLGNYPDFVIELKDIHLAIEARAFLVTTEERERRSKFNRILSTLGSIEKPFAIILKVKKLGDKIETDKFSVEVCQWLDTNADKEFEYKDDTGNCIHLAARQAPNMKKLGVGSSEGFRVNPDVLKPALSAKAHQHKALRKAEYPYVIAVFLEPSRLSAEEVVEAWIGKTVVEYDLENDQVVEEKFDESGIRFFKEAIVHTSVNGILVFKAVYDEMGKSRRLQCWYVQNPHANKSIDPDTFPANSRFVVAGQDDKIFEMKWVK